MSDPDTSSSEAAPPQAEAPSTDDAASSPRNPDSAGLLCPYCGTARAIEAMRCEACKGLLDPLSQQATQNAMGPWFIRDEAQPHRPGCSLETLLALVSRGKVTRETAIRGPSTGQFWYPAARVPGVSHRLGVCHACQESVASDAIACSACSSSFQAPFDREWLGLRPIRPLNSTHAALANGATAPAGTESRGAASAPFGRAVAVGSAARAASDGSEVGPGALARGTLGSPEQPPVAWTRFTPDRARQVARLRMLAATLGGAAAGFAVLSVLLASMLSTARSGPGSASRVAGTEVRTPRADRTPGDSAGESSPGAGVSSAIGDAEPALPQAAGESDPAPLPAVVPARPGTPEPPIARRPLQTVPSTVREVRWP